MDQKLLISVEVAQALAITSCQCSPKDYRRESRYDYIKQAPLPSIRH